MTDQPLVASCSFDIAGSAAANVHPVLLTWRDLSYSLKKSETDSSPKLILHRVSGHAEPGSLTAIIGASGSGKTSLLSVLADRLLQTKGAALTGELLVNGEAAPAGYRSHCAYVQQTEVFYPFSTVRETVEMAARLRLGRIMSVEAKKLRAGQVIQQLGLEKVAGTKVGNDKEKGISGGEMKRVSIACQLVSSPSLVFLDEPTSGLDSSAALNVLKSLKALTSSGRNVVVSVHQPGSALYALFDKLILLGEGRLAYFGPASGAIEYFNKAGYKCPPLFNPADYMLQITSIDFSSPEAESMSRQVLGDIHEKARSSPPLDVDLPKKSSSGLGPAIEKQTTLMEQFQLLLRRIFRDVVRNKVAIGIKVSEGIVAVLFMVALYGNMNDGKVVYVNQSNITALLFFITVSGLFGPIYGTTMTFAPEVSIVLRERMDNLYAIGPYYLAKLLVAAFHEMGPMCVTWTIAYWALQFHHEFSRYLVFLLLTCGLYTSSISVGFVLAVACEGNVQAGTALVGPVFLVLFLFSGFYVNLSTMPAWLTWISNIEYARFAYEGLAINELNGRMVTAKGVHTSDDGNCPKRMSTTQCEEGISILASLFNNGSAKTDSEWSSLMWKNLGFILVSIVTFNILGYLVLQRKGPKYMKMSKPQSAS